MTEGMVADIISEGLMCTLKCALPVLLVSLIIGLLVSIFQTVTSIQEQTLTFVPKILGIFLVIILLGSWILGNITDYMVYLWADFDRFL